MTYQSPYSPPPPAQAVAAYYDPLATLSAPARQSSNLLFVLGILALFLALGAGLFSMINTNSLPPEQKTVLEDFESKTHQSFQVMMRSASVMTLVIGAALIGLGIFVRRGKRPAIVAALLLTGLLVLLLALNILGSFSVGSGPSVVLSLCMLAIPAILLVWLIRQLVAALRNAGAMADYQQQQYAAQWWQYQQQYAAQWAQYQEQLYHSQLQQQQHPQSALQPPPPPPPGNTPT